MHYKCSIFSPFLCLYSTVSRLDMLHIFLLVLLFILFLDRRICRMFLKQATMFYCRVLWTDRIIERYTNVSIKISHMNIIHISDTSTNGPRIIVCYFHFQIHTAHTETFHKRGSECPSYAVKHYFPLLVRDSRTRKQSLL